MFFIIIKVTKTISCSLIKVNRKRCERVWSFYYDALANLDFDAPSDTQSRIQEARMGENSKVWERVQLMTIIHNNDCKMGPNREKSHELANGLVIILFFYRLSNSHEPGYNHPQDQNGPLSSAHTHRAALK